MCALVLITAALEVLVPSKNGVLEDDMMKNTIERSQERRNTTEKKEKYQGKTRELPNFFGKGEEDLNKSKTSRY